MFLCSVCCIVFFFFQAEDGIRDYKVTGVQTCALPIYPRCSRSLIFSYVGYLLDSGNRSAIGLVGGSPSTAGGGRPPARRAGGRPRGGGAAPPAPRGPPAGGRQCGGPARGRGPPPHRHAFAYGFPRLWLPGDAAQRF